ncbi:T9SS type A sorting domain-containing protein [Flavobacteriaceae bacterium F89]|uniref:T9SS type A sorting domain-containing protein n=1 Tax=Cerina litoralis TaxID=2874477 RepID=A0AAE3EUT6_9FLAO|nr:T9SS type A sorting domain-containing protein [Cerina litoralis]MCG2460669.1 T9SS type A sorting domain-containing protein [Cerina litoralis]
MKHLYLITFLAVSSFCFGQDAKKGGDIEGFSLYPNPVTYGKIYITTAYDGPKRIMIFDVFGEKVLETNVRGSEVNLSNLDAGIYVLRVLEKDKMTTRKLIIK